MDNIQISHFGRQPENFSFVKVLNQNIIAISETFDIYSIDPDANVIDKYSNPEIQGPIRFLFLFPFAALSNAIHVIVIDDFGGAFWLLHIKNIGFFELKNLTSSENQRMKCDSVACSTNGAVIAASMSSENESWVNVWKIADNQSKSWNKELNEYAKEKAILQNVPEKETNPEENTETEVRKPVLTLNAGPIKLKKAKTEITAKKGTFSDVFAAAESDVVDVTADDHHYLLTPSMKSQK